MRTARKCDWVYLYSVVAEVCFHRERFSLWRVWIMCLIKELLQLPQLRATEYGPIYADDTCVNKWLYIYVGLHL